MSDRLLSPLGRRIVRKVEAGERTVRQLEQLGWTDYGGPAQMTYSKDQPRLCGWVVPGSDPDVDARRHATTGTLALGITRTVT